MLLNYSVHEGKPFLSRESLLRIESPKTTLAARDRLKYDYGLANYTWHFQGHAFHGHGGDTDGYLSRYGYNRELKLDYFIVINAFSHTALNRM